MPKDVTMGAMKKIDRERWTITGALALWALLLTLKFISQCH